MEKHTELLKGLVISRRRDGRCIYDAEAKLELIRACLQPGVSIARLALKHGVNANLLRTWVARYQREESKHAVASQSENKSESTGAFTPVRIEAAIEDKLSSNLFAVRAPQMNTNGEPGLSSIVSMPKAQPHLSVGLHVQLPNGVAFDIAEVAMDSLLPVVEMLGSLPCSDSMTR